MNVRVLGVFLFLIGLFVACGSSDDSIFNDGSKDAGTGTSPPLINPNSDSGTPPDQGGGACFRTCEQLGASCGPAGDGCGNLVQCGTCNAPDTCGGGTAPSVCGGGTGGICTPKTCTDFPANSCGPLADGCGGLITCGSCKAPQFCGGGGTPSVCGGNSGCIPRTPADCATNNVQCGPLADGCGGSVDCGGCGTNQSCGAGGASKCGTATGGTCTPKKCTDLGFTCGPAGDGCGGLLDCGMCTPPASCGGGGVASKCGGTTGCKPKTCAELGVSCGAAGDGCGGTLDCKGCTAPQTCGGGGTPSACGGSNACVPKTAADCTTLGLNCGLISDGCGGTVQCGATCPNGGVCGGAAPNVCSAGGGTCTGFCTNIDNTCAAASKTKLTGTVFAPNGTLPIPGALIYVPNGAAASPFGVTPITAGVSGSGTCEQCSGTASGNPLVSTTSAFDGKFTLDNVPAGVAFPIVIQLGKWRRMVMVGPVTKCTSAALTPAQTRLPTRQNEGANGVDNIPLVAISTGSIDGLECVFKKLGITSSGANNQFSNPGGTGRIQLFLNNSGGSAGAKFDNNTPNGGSQLWDKQADLDRYDAVVFGCGGPPGNWATSAAATAAQPLVRAYADKGGRVFATHYQYVWLYNNAPWSTTSSWNPEEDTCGNPGSGCSWTGQVDTTPGKRLLFSQWLGAPAVNALSGNNPPRVTLIEARNDADHPLSASAEDWIDRYNTPTAPDGSKNDAVLHYTFNTPLGAAAANQCGRVLYSDFHVTIGSTAGTTFPNECGASNTLTPQEKILAFFLFDLTSCIDTQTPTSCTPKTCAAYPGKCGQQSDGCGGTTPDCNPCTLPQTCGGGGVADQCGGTACTKRSCGTAKCGPVADGCGGLLDCGTCVDPQTCGGGGVSNQCGNPACIATTCAAQGFNCGPAGDGCGGLLQCGDCTTPLICGGGGSPGVCGDATCAPLTCKAQGAECGPVADGCGGLVQCGPCPSGQVCGGAGPSKCGAGSCTPRSCQAAGATCGPIGDGCGGTVDCGPCTMPGQTCGGAGVPNVCGGCTRTTCQAAGAECGPIGDGCGGSIDCGVCANPSDSCGGGGTPFKCGQPIVH